MRARFSVLACDLLGVLGMIAITAGSPAIARAQSEVQLWTESGMRVRLHPRLRLDASTLVRTGDGSLRVDRVGQDVGLSVRLSRAVRLAGGYRLTWLPERGQGDEVRHRANLDLRLRSDLGRARLSTRLRWQARFSDGDDPLHTLRPRLAVGIDTDSAATPYVSAELFVLARDERPLWLRAWRATLGVELEVADHELDLFYMVEVPRESGEPTLHILGVGHRFDVP